jgi:WD40 repeat protein
MRELKGRIGKLRAVAYSPDGKLLAAAGDNGVTKIWELATNREVAVLQPPDLAAATKVEQRRVRHLAFSPDGKLLATAQQRIRVWDVGTSAEVTFPDALGASGDLALAFTPDGKLIITRSWEIGRPGEPRMFAWNRRTGKITQPFGVRTDSAEALALSAAADLLAVGVYDNGPRVRLWGLMSKKEQGTIDLPKVPISHQHATVPSVAISPDGRTLAAAACWSVFVCDVSGLRVRGTLEREGTFGTTMNSVAFSRDGRLLATASEDGCVRLWNAKELTLRSTHDWQTGPARAVAFSPDGLTAAVAGEKSRVVIWDLE